MVCCLYVGICFGVEEHIMPDLMLALAWRMGLYKMRTQNRDFTCEVCHSQNRRGLGANDGEKRFLVCSHLCLFLVSVFRNPLLISHNSR